MCRHVHIHIQPGIAWDVVAKHPSVSSWHSSRVRVCRYTLIKHLWNKIWGYQVWWMWWAQILWNFVVINESACAQSCTILLQTAIHLVLSSNEMICMVNYLQCSAVIPSLKKTISCNWQHDSAHMPPTFSLLHGTSVKARVFRLLCILLFWLLMCPLRWNHISCVKKT